MFVGLQKLSGGFGKGRGFSGLMFCRNMEGLYLDGWLFSQKKSGCIFGG